MVVDVTGGIDIVDLGQVIFQTALEEAQKARPNGPPLSYIYCSGMFNLTPTENPFSRT